MQSFLKPQYLRVGKKKAPPKKDESSSDEFDSSSESEVEEEKKKEQDIPLWPPPKRMASLNASVRLILNSRQGIFTAEPIVNERKSCSGGITSDEGMMGYITNDCGGGGLFALYVKV